MASKQALTFAPVPGRGNGIGQAVEVVSPAEMSPRAGRSAASAIDAQGPSANCFRGFLLRRRCDSCGTRIHLLGEGDDDRVFMRCPECLRDYVFFNRTE